MHARVTRFSAPTEGIEKLITYFTGTVIPTYSAMAGYKGAVTLMDRAKGIWQSITFWDNEATMHASDQAAAQLRQTATKDLKLGDLTIETYEVGPDQRLPTLEQPPASKAEPRATEASRH